MGVPFVAESWIWFSAGVFIVSCRLFSRFLTAGSIKKLRFQVDDWLMLLALASYTTFIVTINKEVDYNSNLIDPTQDVNNLSPADIKSRAYGSKLTLVVEQMQCLTVWLLKGCLLILYLRLTDGLPSHRYVKALMVYVGTSFVVMEILYFAVWCRPFHNYWAIPSPNKQCSAATNHLITNAVFNLSSDVVMLIIAFSLFIRSRLPWDRKLILSCVFGLGIFVILCAVLNKYYSFTHPFGSQWTFWYVRESSTTLLVSNIPFTWTILRRLFKLNAFHAERPKSIAYHSQRSARGRGRTHHPTGSGTKPPIGTIMAQKPTNGGTYTPQSSLDPNQPPSSPISICHPSVVYDKNRKRTSWKTQGFYGREELDALAIEPWDFGNDEDIVVGDAATVSTTDKASTDKASITHPSSPRSNHNRKLRDEEAQFAMQEGRSLTYHDFTKVDDEELGFGKEKEMGLMTGKSVDFV